MRRTLFALLATAALSTLGAQGAPAASPAATPAGWSMRFDDATAKPADVTFVTMGSGMHVTSGPAAVYWNKANTAGAGPWAFGATFSQRKAPEHPEAYGLMWAAKNLDAGEPSYLYYIVRGDGKYAVKHRANSKDVHNIVDWTDSDALVKANDKGAATNALEVRVGADSVRLFANGKPVVAFSAAIMADNSGTYGFRVNHMLDVHVAGFGKK